MGCVTSTGLDLTGPEWLAVTPSSEESDFQKKYSLGPRLGEGSFGEVRWQAEHRHTNSPVAVLVWEMGKRSGPGNARNRGDASQKRSSSKGMTRAGSKSQESPAAFHKAAQAELQLLRAVGQHRHCIQLYDVFHEAGAYYVVTEPWKESLAQHMASPAPPFMAWLPELQRLLREMALGVAHVHELKIVHRDIKPSNFLVGGADGKTIKLSDFGAAAQLPSGGGRRGGKLHSVLGTAPYMSPEMIGDEGYDQTTDVWSLGCTYYELLFGEIPYCPKEKTPGKIKAAILFGVPEPSFKVAEGRLYQAPQGVEDLVRGCLRRDPARRPAAAKVLRHIFLRDSKENQKLLVPGKPMRASSSQNLLREQSEGRAAQHGGSPSSSAGGRSPSSSPRGWSPDSSVSTATSIAYSNEVE